MDLVNELLKCNVFKMPHPWKKKKKKKKKAVGQYSYISYTFTGKIWFIL